MCFYLKSIAIIVFFTVINASPVVAQDAPPDFSLVPEHCKAVIKENGWGIICPSRVNEKIAKNNRKAPFLSLPGYSSGKMKFPKYYESYPTLCNPARLRFTSHASEFAAGLRGENLRASAWNVLTRQAVYELVQIIKSYTLNVDSKAMDKYRSSPRGTSDGDIACKAYYDHGYEEIDRIAHIVVDELNKGNRDLTNTGLNLNESPYNR
ncbi:MAG: hypothetical protein COA81_05910 [Alphaproteobacteria bacterium]|nr:MAG: hypothetical protein COA81_05910 [Alphaproteobacteria bacterium]